MATIVNKDQYLRIICKLGKVEKTKLISNSKRNGSLIAIYRACAIKHLMTTREHSILKNTHITSKTKIMDIL